MKPNILLLHWHDLGRFLGCYGRPGVRSPHLDRLARDGVLFTNAWCTSPLCSPSRGALMTGRYPSANGLTGLAHLGFELNPDELTLPQSLARAGWRTALFGFQHERRDPHSLGYEEVFQPAAGPPFGATLIPFWREFLHEARDDARPFLASVGFYEAHRVDFKIGFTSYPPVATDHPTPLPPWVRPTPEAHEDFGGFYAAIETGDRAVGEFLDALREAGLEQSTLVIFTTDHGAPFPGAKGTLYEPGLETALMMKWPGWLPAGIRCDALVSNVDLFPTLHERLGLPVPAAVQGQNFWPVGQGSGRSTLFAESFGPVGDDPQYMIRRENWKLIRSLKPGPKLALPRDLEGSLLRKGMGDAHLAPRALAELYNLATDPWERTNLAGNPRCREVESHLAAELQRWRDDTYRPSSLSP